MLHQSLHSLYFVYIYISQTRHALSCWGVCCVPSFKRETSFPPVFCCFSFWVKNAIDEHLPQRPPFIDLPKASVCGALPSWSPFVCPPSFGWLFSPSQVRLRFPEAWHFLTTLPSHGAMGKWCCRPPCGESEDATLENNESCACGILSDRAGLHIRCLACNIYFVRFTHQSTFSMEWFLISWICSDGTCVSCSWLLFSWSASCTRFWNLHISPWRRCIMVWNNLFFSVKISFGFRGEQSHSPVSSRSQSSWQ